MNDHQTLVGLFELLDYLEQKILDNPTVSFTLFNDHSVDFRFYWSGIDREFNYCLTKERIDLLRYDKIIGPGIVNKANKAYADLCDQLAKTMAKNMHEKLEQDFFDQINGFKPPSMIKPWFGYTSRTPKKDNLYNILLSSFSSTA